MKGNITTANVGAYKKMLLEIHMTYHKADFAKEHRKIRIKQFIRWVFGN